jgi:ArsR family transcriptional regulator
MSGPKTACETGEIALDWCPDCEEKARFVSVLMEPQRIKILRLLRSGERCVCEIERSLGVPQNLVSHHLKILREAGLVVSRKEGQFVYYARVEDRIHQLTRSLDELVKP